MNTLVITTTNATETQDLGRMIGQRLDPGSVIALMGELGCGKTCFTQGLCGGLGIPIRCVTSPTFTFINEYSGRLPVFHFDLYRADDIDTILEIGALDCLTRAERGVAVIEWAEKILPLLQDNLLEMKFSVLSLEKREIQLVDVSGKFSQLCEELAREPFSKR